MTSLHSLSSAQAHHHRANQVRPNHHRRAPAPQQLPYHLVTVPPFLWQVQRSPFVLCTLSSSTEQFRRNAHASKKRRISPYSQTAGGCTCSVLLRFLLTLYRR